MSNIGFWELVLLAVIGLLIMGPERLMRTAIQAGRWYGRWQRSFQRIRRLVRAELDQEKDLFGADRNPIPALSAENKVPPTPTENPAPAPPPEPQEKTPAQSNSVPEKPSGSPDSS